MHKELRLSADSYVVVWRLASHSSTNVSAASTDMATSPFFLPENGGNIMRSKTEGGAERAWQRVDSFGGNKQFP